MRGGLVYRVGVIGALLGVGCPGGGETSAGDGETGTSSSSDETGSSSSTSSSTTGVETTAVDGSSSSDSSGQVGSSTGGPIDEVTVFFPRTSILPEELAVVVNDNDPLSMEIADYYVQARQIPPENVVHLSFATGAVLPPEDFDPIKQDLDAQLGAEIQAIALTFTNPYRVGCMSVTSAFAFGFDTMWCNTSGGACGETAPSVYYDTESLAPFTDHGMRPTMMIAAVSLENAKDLIDRGIASDGTHPVGDGYMIRTTDMARSVRWPIFEATVGQWDHAGGLDLFFIDNGDGSGLNYIENTQNVLFYFTGLVDVPQIATNQYLPGAIADHLTSFGGQVPDSGQMSVLRWLEAGATASYGTVVEPCNYLAKFPDTSIVIPYYFRGQTLIEAYWKSVRWPGEGLFIGEPLARPWDGSTVELIDGDLHITTTLFGPSIDYDVEKSSAPDGPWEHVLTGSIPEPQTFTLVIENVDRPYYRIIPAP